MVQFRILQSHTVYHVKPKSTVDQKSKLFLIQYFQTKRGSESTNKRKCTG